MADITGDQRIQSEVLEGLATQVAVIANYT